jgi:hypothetical protein
MPLQQLAPAAAKADRSALSASTLADKSSLARLRSRPKEKFHQFQACPSPAQTCQKLARMGMLLSCGSLQ